MMGLNEVKTVLINRAECVFSWNRISTVKKLLLNFITGIKTRGVEVAVFESLSLPLSPLEDVIFA